MICPNPDCTGEDLEYFEVERRMGLLGSGLWVDCPDCGASIEIEVNILEPRRTLPTINGAPTPA